MNTRMNWLAPVLATLSVAPVSAQAQGGDAAAADHAQHHEAAKAPPAAAKSTPDQPPMQGMDHSTTDHGSMTPDAAEPMPGMSGAAMDGQPPSSGNAGTAGMAGMDHGDRKAQGGPAPADARDPHAYSGGYALDRGPYALPGPRQLRMADEHRFGSVLLDRLEHVRSRGAGATAYDAQAWYGRDYDRLVIKAEGEVARGRLRDARTELLWGHAVAPYWDTQAGVRYDSGVGPGRGWLAFGIQGLAPYWFETDVTAYLGGNGRTALRLGAEYEILLTQKLILQPRVEFNLYGKDDAAREIGSGLSDGVAGLRLRYEINRQLAPYIGVERSGKFGRTADFARAGGERAAETRWVAGVRFWF